LALNKALQLFGMEISRYDHLVTYDGLPTKKKLEMLSSERGLPKELHTFINNMKQQYTMEIVYSNCKPTFHHEFALSKLKNAGYKMAVCSNSIRNTIEIMMQKSSLEHNFEFYVSNQDVKNGKPDPEMYNKAIEKLGLNPKECMIIEDNENGIKAAKASGAWVMEVDVVEDVNIQNIEQHIKMFEEKI
ncbi:HAD family hydrolase, partial [bacterium]|nr:HAD family hydrolase [bacterium]